jgi:hypothetical protein
VVYGVDPRSSMSGCRQPARRKPPSRRVGEVTEGYEKFAARLALSPGYP